MQDVSRAYSLFLDARRSAAYLVRLESRFFVLFFLLFFLFFLFFFFALRYYFRRGKNLQNALSFISRLSPKFSHKINNQQVEFADEYMMNEAAVEKGEDEMAA